MRLCWGVLDGCDYARLTWGNVRFIAGFLQPLLLLLKALEAFAELVERARDVAVLRVATQVQGPGTLLLKERQLDVVGEEEERVGIRHGDARND